VTTATVRSRRPPGWSRAWQLPDDGIVDWIAVILAASGTRPVALTQTERRIAAARIVASGGTLHDLSVRLQLPERAARRLYEDLTRCARGRAA
jgi:hypothetical protein